MLYANLTCPHCGCILKRIKKLRYECRACHADVGLPKLIILINKDKTTIPVIDPEGNKGTAKVIIDFRFLSDNNEFMCYTFGNPERDKIYIALVDRSNPDNPTLLEASDMDKERVEIVLNDVAFKKDKLEIV